MRSVIGIAAQKLCNRAALVVRKIECRSRGIEYFGGAFLAAFLRPMMSKSVRRAVCWLSYQIKLFVFFNDGSFFSGARRREIFCGR